MEVRKLTSANLDQLAPLFDQYRQFYGKPTDLTGAKTFLAERLTQNDSEVFGSFDMDGTMTGFVQLYPLWSSTRMKRLWLLNDLYVHPSHRGLGISVALIAEAKNLCQRTHSCGMYLETAKTNEIGISLYPKTGFLLDQEHNFYYWDV